MYITYYTYEIDLRFFFYCRMISTCDQCDLYSLSSGALAKRVQRKDPEDGGHRTPKEQQQPTGLRMDDGPNYAVVFERKSE